MKKFHSLIDQAHEKAKLLLDDKSVGYNLDFLKEYVINITEINNKDLIRIFTIEINKNIDNANLSNERTSDLKTMIAIAENSFSLWEITEK